MAKVGDRYDPEYGVTWYDGNAPDGPPRGYYPRWADGGENLRIRLRWVDDAPTNPEDGSGHFEVMPTEAGYGYFHGKGGGVSGGMTGTIAPGPTVDLEAHAKGRGKSNVDAEKPRNRIKYWLRGNE